MTSEILIDLNHRYPPSDQFCAAQHLAVECDHGVTCGVPEPRDPATDHAAAVREFSTEVERDHETIRLALRKAWKNDAVRVVSFDPALHPAEDVSAKADRATLRRNVESAMNELPERYSRVIAAKFFGPETDAKHGQLAASLGLTEATFNQQLRRGKALLRDIYLAKFGEPGSDSRHENHDSDSDQAKRCHKPAYQVGGDTWTTKPFPGSLAHWPPMPTTAPLATAAERAS